MWRSRKYNNAPMPWAIFFHGGYAIHGTTDLRNLGRPASHGCVRLHPANAKAFFALVQKSGKDNTTISIVR
jgi:lipoprotein-anchoring transpeptidase ErfK/SrfK